MCVYIYIYAIIIIIRIEYASPARQQTLRHRNG